jgi:hypothetical protein
VLRDNTLADFTEVLRNAKNQTNETFTKMDPKYLYQFVQNFRLHYWLNGKNVTQLAQLANKPSADDEQGQWIVSMGIQCWRVNEQQLNGLDRSFLQVVNTDIFHEDQNSEYIMRPFKLLQENSTKKRYLDFFSAWIYMTYQVWKKQEFAE